MVVLQLLLLTLLWGGSALANEISIHPQCAKGPTYWCKNLMTAIQCGTLQHCVQAGWNWTTNEDMCTDCEQIVTILMRMAKESAFKEAIQKYLEHECTTLPLQTLIPRCQTLVDTYFALFISTMEGQIKPSSVCTKLGLCHSEPIASENTFDELVPVVEQFFQLLQGKALITPNSQTQAKPGEELPIPLPLCWMCRSFVGRIESTLPKGAIAKSLSQLCRILPAAIAGMCQCLMEKYTVIIVDLILGKLGPRLICGMMLMCATEENCGPEMSPGLLPCQACLAISSQVKLSLKANTTQTEIEAALLSTCSSTYSDWQKECESFVYQHQSKLATLLTKPWSSQTTCQELGACVAEGGSFSGNTACAQGPTYWCSSLSAAEQCKAVQHCQAHVWM
ncbi:pulmonary surfactant-associated protein B [Eublepharis macularius]|uniref:Pulmonary surfactant-associated protein B n=1 Tax=Eublepharis macularius TaxID=481883 RepID=A0AA97LEN1_EUBMA|nr:pulmonary surfactant-associated protein B [Eublepharis macularius]